MHHLCPFQAVGGARERAALTADTHADTTQKYHKEKVPSFFLRRPAAADYTAVQSASWLTDTRRAVLFCLAGRSLYGGGESPLSPGLTPSMVERNGNMMYARWKYRDALHHRWSLNQLLEHDSRRTALRALRHRSS